MCGSAHIGALRSDERTSVRSRSATHNTRRYGCFYPKKATWWTIKGKVRGDKNCLFGTPGTASLHPIPPGTSYIDRSSSTETKHIFHDKCRQCYPQIKSFPNWDSRVALSLSSQEALDTWNNWEIGPTKSLFFRHNYDNRRWSLGFSRSRYTTTYLGGAREQMPVLMALSEISESMDNSLISKRFQCEQAWCLNAINPPPLQPRQLMITTNQKGAIENRPRCCR